jgi:hypothetical protein
VRSHAQQQRLDRDRHKKKEGGSETDEPIHGALAIIVMMHDGDDNDNALSCLAMPWTACFGQYGQVAAVAH